MSLPYHDAISLRYKRKPSSMMAFSSAGWQIATEVIIHAARVRRQFIGWERVFVV
jgi:hypothetical protein